MSETLSPGSLTGLRVAQLLESDGPGGAESVVVHLSRRLREAGAEVVVYVPRDGQGWLRRQLDGVDIAFEEFHLDRPLSPPFARWLTASFHRHRIEVAHSHEFTFAVYGAWAAWRSGVGHVITMHGGRYYAAQWRRRLALRAAAAVSHRLIAVSEPLKAYLAQDLHLSPDAIQVIPNGVPFTSASGEGVRESLGIPAGAPFLLSVGNLYPVKGHAHLLAALHRLTARHPHVHLAIAGRGQLEESLRAQAARLGLAERVHLLGLRSDVPRLLAAADIFVLPSLSEGLPMAILEAMFAGKPILASDVGGIKAALGGDTGGVVVPAGDETALASTLDAMLGDPGRARAMGERARERALREFELDTMTARYVRLYQTARRR